MLVFSPRTSRRIALRGLVGTLLVAGFTPLLNIPKAASTPSVHESTSAVADGTLADGDAHRFDVDGGPELIALTWDAPVSGAFELRALDDDGWSDWLTLETDGEERPDAASGEPTERNYVGPAWLGRDISEIELRSTGPDVRGLTIHAIDSEPVTPASGMASAGVATPPTMITRAQWSADESWRDDSGGECDGTPDYVDGIKLGYVHHTAGDNAYGPSDSAAILRAIYNFHVHTNGWCDIAYNFFVDQYGQVFEGRYGGIRRAVIGGHASGFNSVSTGVAVIGDFTTTAVPQVAYNSIVDVLAFKLGFHGVNPTGSSTVTVGSTTSAKWPEGTSVTLKNISGHGDSNNTSCPGAQLAKLLPQLRTDVANAIQQRGFTPAFTLSRLSGADRYATAAAIAKSAFPSSNVAYLSRGDGFADALAANLVAGINSAPILLSGSNAVPPATLDALKAMGVKRVDLLGGPAAIEPAVETILRNAGYEVNRLGGEDRFATAANIAAAAGSGAVGVDDQGRRTAVVSAGWAFPDALAAGGIVFAKHFPQLLSEQGGLPTATASALTSLGVQHVLLTGGPAALAPAVETQIKGLGLTVERVAGDNRYGTAVALADLAIDRFGFTPNHLTIATGDAFPDALTGGGFAGKRPGPVVLVQTTVAETNTPACAFVRRRAAGIAGGTILGGTKAVDSGAKWALEECRSGF
ncbi:MAG: cell wall-binding repeat-containing protein [Actinomycetota bacterium]|nr:cell wall-binding repeat-containing protein [Actinomycetota bacterium]